MPPNDKSSISPETLRRYRGVDHIVDAMIEHKVPLNRENYLRWRVEDSDALLDAEIEASIPEPFRLWKPEPFPLQIPEPSEHPMAALQRKNFLGMILLPMDAVWDELTPGQQASILNAQQKRILEQIRDRNAPIEEHDNTP